jgi:hypothetical protein
MGHGPSEVPNNQMNSSLIDDLYDANEQDR